MSDGAKVTVDTRKTVVVVDSPASVTSSTGGDDGLGPLSVGLGDSVGSTVGSIVIKTDPGASVVTTVGAGGGITGVDTADVGACVPSSCNRNKTAKITKTLGG